MVSLYNQLSSMLPPNTLGNQPSMSATAEEALGDILQSVLSSKNEDHEE